MENNDKSFKDETVGTKIFIVIIVSFLVMFAIGFVIGIYYFGILGIFNLLGIQYKSLFSVFLFVIFYFLLGLVGDIVNKVFEVLLSSFSMNKLTTKLVRFLFASLVNWSIISCLDYFMQSISISIETQIIAASIIAIIEVYLENDDKQKNQQTK